jgi:hypothetical protein
LARYGRDVKKALLYYDTDFSASIGRGRSAAAFFGLLCGKSQMKAGCCDNLKNLALSIEPPGSPARPTLRDGH